MESILKVEKYKQNSLHIELMFKDIVEFEKPNLSLQLVALQDLVQCLFYVKLRAHDIETVIFEVYVVDIVIDLSVDDTKWRIHDVEQIVDVLGFLLGYQ